MFSRKQGLGIQIHIKMTFVLSNVDYYILLVLGVGCGWEGVDWTGKCIGLGRHQDTTRNPSILYKDPN